MEVPLFSTISWEMKVKRDKNLTLDVENGGISPGPRHYEGQREGFMALPHL
jgi:hypothetical protein